MITENELWNDSRVQSHYEILGEILRSEFKLETVKRIDLSYLSIPIRNWWFEVKQNNFETNFENQFANLKSLVLLNLKSEHQDLINSIGSVQSRNAPILLYRMPLFTQERMLKVTLFHIKNQFYVVMRLKAYLCVSILELMIVLVHG